MFGRIQSIDNSVLERIGRIHRPALNRIMIIISKAGNFGFIWWMVCIPFFVLPNWRITGFNFVFALCFAHLMGEIILKHIVRRVRPCHHLDEDEQLIDPPRFYSFPSGHTTASFAFVGVALMKCTPAVFFPILTLAALIAFSRIYLRVHYLTDVLCGILLGLICGISSVFIFNAMVNSIMSAIL